MGGRGDSAAGGFSKSLVQATVYHGTNVADITKFSTGGKESNGAIFFANDPDYAEEEAYVKAERGGERTLYEVKLNIRNPQEVTLSGSQFADPATEAKYIRAAKAAGHDAVIFHGSDGFSDQTFYAVFSPKQVKIKNKKKL